MKKFFILSIYFLILLSTHTVYSTSVFAPPSCVELSFPRNGSSDIPLDTNIVWNQDNLATGYTLRIGTTPMGTEVANDLDMGDVLFFDPLLDLNPNTTYYVLVIPYNLDGPAANCQYDIFTTGTSSLSDGITDLVSCESGNNFDGLTISNLTIKDDEILQGDADLSVFYYLTEDDANLSMNLITDPENFANTTNPQTLWIRIINNTDPSIIIPATSFELVVEVDVNARNTSVLSLPDDNGNGFNTFDLSLAENQITNNTPGLNLQYFVNRIDAVQNNSLNQLTASEIVAFTNTVNPQEIWVRVSDVNGCYEVVRLILRVGCELNNNGTPVLNSIPPMAVCDDTDGNDLNDIGIFNLDQKRGQIYNDIGLSSDVMISFHATEAQAIANSSPLTGNYTSAPTFIYVRIDGGAQGCNALIETMAIIVVPLPVVIMEPEYILCLNYLPEPLRINAPFGFDEYEWRLAGDPAIISTANTLNVTVAGTYNLTVIENSPYGTSCENDTDFEVVASNLATVVDVDVQDIMKNNTVTVFVEGEGDYEYIIDNPEGTYQDSPTFEDVRPGFRTVYIRDKNGCGITPHEVAVIGYPKFFTPNGDGFHDTWQIAGIDSSVPTDTEIYIYDRFGKFIKQIRTDSPGWDGFVDGKMYPSTDYWFNVILEDGRTFKGHFTLKR